LFYVSRFKSVSMDRKFGWIAPAAARFIAQAAAGAV